MVEVEGGWVLWQKANDKNKIAVIKCKSISFSYFDGMYGG